ncbi:unnamed protein product [Penicillium salamii]|uniref:Zn(2)-C6 fungal-type domain-containing protein n=1 Tax=Penicillium salamii TaxID=1612424 RepID=A0A9W4NZ63_9EURO|nr:unnamed protein product [Penicillium salamii]CAG8105044.1 unnamed protein product [Penicillium salamii]CAG8186576.1 unnamed protein product [Penicillium salamii]CAG8246688.1 unnamed protein product [Penicillium salamii]CAG8343360.1 unnamed protein product [Penicillium salamii]
MYGSMSEIQVKLDRIINGRYRRRAQPVIGRTFRRGDLPLYNNVATRYRQHSKHARGKMGPKEKKPARITIACNACRSRKQKCSGQKPICGQCLENNRPCKWPEQLRRGPEKGYAEALEKRLQLTESILLNLLPHVSDEQLSWAIPHRESGQEHTTPYVPFPRLERRGIDTWSQFPLDTTRSVRRWQQACVDGSVSSDAPSPKKRRVHESPSKYSGESVQVSNETLGIEGAFVQPSYSSVPDATSSIEGHPTQSPGDANEQSPAMQKMSTWDGAPSLEFQRQFLW